MTGRRRTEAVKSGINVYGQSVASDILQKAHHLLDEWLDPAEAFVVGQVHDSLLVEVRNPHMWGVAQSVRHAMLGAPDHLRLLGLCLPPGLLTVEVQAGPWGAGELLPEKELLRSWRELQEAGV